MTSTEIRDAFLGCFAARGHQVVPSSPLVTVGDPSLLFTTAGMVQFRPYYTAGVVPYSRAASAQRCLRLTDLERVGASPVHSTFFEMLGNFSFGPDAYGKRGAIAFAWEFLTVVLEIPASRLSVTVFAGDADLGLPRDEVAADAWRAVGVPESRIAWAGRECFWDAPGGSGACGPCSEIYYAPERGEPVEIWNLVFPQFNAAGGKLEPLAHPGIDTGAGLDRLAMVVQGRSSIFETDLLAPLVRDVGEPHALTLTNARVVADHARAAAIAIAEGVRPAGTGAGYVVRRLLRRAFHRLWGGATARYAADIAPTAIEHLADAYPDVLRASGDVLAAFERERLAFARTYAKAMRRLEPLVASGVVTGADAFELHDTHGFPIELTEEIAASRGAVVDRAGFDRAMAEQRERSRGAR